MDCNTPGSSVLHFLPPRVCSNSCPLSQWCYLIISSFAAHFSFYPQYFPASGSFPMSQLFPSGGRSIGASASASALPMSIKDWSPLGWTGLISLLSMGLSKIFSSTTFQKHQFYCTQTFYGPEKVTGRKARGLQREEIGCKCQTFFISVLSGRRKQTLDIFPLSIQI